MKILICGAGVAGLTLAWHLERAGWDVELVEIAPEFRDGGYMIDFFGPGHEVAERMGLLPQLEKAGYRLTSLGYVDGRGHETSHFDMPDGFSGVISLLRGDLARAIADGVTSPVHYGTSIAAIEQDDAGVDVTLTDGTRRRVDLLVGADGVHSRVRELTFGEEREFLRYLGHHVAAYFLTEPELHEQVGVRYRMLTEPGLMVGAYAVRGDRLAALFLHQEPDPAVPDDIPAALRARYGDLGWVVPRLLDGCPPGSEIYYDQVTQVEMDSWSKGRVALLGDACQAVSLFAGHGASLGVAAGRVLADELAELDDAAGLPQALHRYHERMSPVVLKTQKFGRGFIKWMAPDGRWRMTARDMMFRLGAVPGFKQLFLRSMMPGGHSSLRLD